MRPDRPRRAVAGRLTARSAARLALVAAATFFFVQAGTAWAVPAKPPTDSSFYVRYPYNGGATPDTSSNAYHLGCNQGSFDASHGNADSEVILDFGAQNSGNTGTYLTFTNTFVTYANIEHYAENFAYGYWVCTGGDTTSVLTLDMGTNNSGACVTNACGTTWGNVVKTAYNWTTTGTYSFVSSQVTIYGANDIEPAWSSQSNAIAWTNGYNGSGPTFYVNFGSCDGCPTTATTGNGYTFTPCQGCSSWNQYGVWEVSWGEPLGLAMPEIYVNPQQTQWAAISYYGKIAKSSTVYYEGPLDEYNLDTSTYTASQAWTNFWNALQGFGGAIAQTPFYSSEIHKTSS